VHQNPVEDLKSKLRQWSLRNSITFKALSQLLVLIGAWLRIHCGFLAAWLPQFPKDARLLQTNAQNVNIREMGFGTYT